MICRCRCHCQGRQGHKSGPDLSWRELSVEGRLAHALVKGINDFVVEDGLSAVRCLSRKANRHFRSSKGR